MKPRSRAEDYAAEGIEKLCGKGWAQLEAERLQAQEDEINSRVTLLTCPTGWRPCGVSQVRSDIIVSRGLVF